MGRHRHILIVEDDYFLRNLLSEELGVRGYAVVSAINGFQALDLIDSNPVLAVITDIFMPDMDGIELIQTLRKHHPAMPIFAMSGGVRHADVEDFLGFAKCFGADEVFAKPVDMAALVTKLADYSRHDSKCS